MEQVLASRSVSITELNRSPSAVLAQAGSELYVPRGCGLSVEIKNAQGKGAKHAVGCREKWAIHAIG